MLDTLIHVAVLGLALIGLINIIDMMLDSSCEHLPCMRGQYRGVYYLLCARCLKAHVHKNGQPRWMHPRLAMFVIDDMLHNKEANRER